MAVTTTGGDPFFLIPWLWGEDISQMLQAGNIYQAISPCSCGHFSPNVGICHPGLPNTCWGLVFCVGFEFPNTSSRLVFGSLGSWMSQQRRQKKQTQNSNKSNEYASRRSKRYNSLKLTVRPLKMDGWNTTVVSFWDGLCSGAMLVSGSSHCSEKTTKETSNVYRLCHSRCSHRHPRHCWASWWSDSIVRFTSNIHWASGTLSQIQREVILSSQKWRKRKPLKVGLYISSHKIGYTIYILWVHYSKPLKCSVFHRESLTTSTRLSDGLRVCIVNVDLGSADKSYHIPKFMFVGKMVVSLGWYP